MKDPYDAYYDENYFKFRMGNDPKRQKCFLFEKKFINAHIRSGTLLDIGCSTGEFVKALEWDGIAYGMEISEFAKKYAKKNGIKFGKDIFNSKNYFDLIIFRGTIQHIDTPFLYLKQAFQALKPGGYVWFYAPNANSMYYKIWNTLASLDPKINFYIPSDITLKNAMKNFGYEFTEIHYPYLDSPYASPVTDHLKFAMKLFGANVQFPFWRSIMYVMFRKPKPAR